MANVPADYVAPWYCEIAKVQPRVTAATYPAPPLTHADLVTTGGEEPRVTAEARLMPWLTRQLVTLDALVPGCWCGRIPPES